MNFADKLIMLRKKSGWSQEELADQIDVTRQSVSKWEGSQSIPDLDKMIKLSELFGVTTDYLLKDYIEDTEIVTEELPTTHKVSLQEANAFIAIKQKTSNLVASATSLCILSPIILGFMEVASELQWIGLSKTNAGIVALILVVLLVAIAVALFIYSGSQTSPFEYLETEMFETEYGVVGMVKQLKEKQKSRYTLINIIGVGLCIVSIIPLFLAVVINESNNLIMMSAFALMLGMVALAVWLFIRYGIVWASYEKLLQEGDYSKQNKKSAPWATLYWSIVTVVFLVCLFLFRNEESILIWVGAAILYPAYTSLIHHFSKKD